MSPDDADEKPGPERTEELEQVEALTGAPGSDPEEERLMHSVLESDDDVRDGKLLADAYDYNLSSFQPDLLFEQLTKGFRQAKQLYGPTFIRELTGYSDEYIEKNIKIPEFQQHLQQRITKTVDELRKKKLLDQDGQTTEEGVKLAAIVRYTEELEKLETKGLGRQEYKERSPYGERDEPENYKKHLHRFHDLNMTRSVNRAIRRGHDSLRREDLVAHRRIQRGRISIIYAVDASGSMRGAKLRMAKQAGVALAYKAIEEKNDVGLIIFTSKIEQSLAPGRDFLRILESLTVTRAGLETDIALTIEEAVALLSREQGTKHLVLLTDAMPTKTVKNKGPKRRVLEAASAARDSDVTISVVGINLDTEGEKLARRIVEIGRGKLYRVRNTDELDAIILDDYESIKEK